MNRYRRIVESMKKEFAADLEAGKTQYIHAVIRSIDYEYRQYAKDNEVIDLKNFADKLLKRLKVPATTRMQISNELGDMQLKIGNLWKEMFETETGIKIDERTTTNLLASYKIDFGDIDLASTVEREAKIAVNKGEGYYDLRTALTKKNLGFGEVNTLANTAIAQFDNAAHIENAKQAGVIYYLYDGAGAQREFCKEHLGRVYTIAELSAMNNHQGLSVVTSLGGYNCTHYLTALINYVRKAYGELLNETHFKKAA